MGLQTLIEGNGDKKPHRRGDVALIVAIILSALEAYHSLVPPAQAAMEDPRMIQMAGDVNQLKAESVATRIDLGVLKEKVRALENKR